MSKLRVRAFRCIEMEAQTSRIGSKGKPPVIFVQVDQDIHVFFSHQPVGSADMIVLQHWPVIVQNGHFRPDRQTQHPIRYLLQFVYRSRNISRFPVVPLLKIHHTCWNFWKKKKGGRTPDEPHCVIPSTSLNLSPCFWIKHLELCWMNSQLTQWTGRFPLFYYVR